MLLYIKSLLFNEVGVVFWGRRKIVFIVKTVSYMKVLSVDAESDRKTNWNTGSEKNKIRCSTLYVTKLFLKKM